MKAIILLLLAMTCLSSFGSTRIVVTDKHSVKHTAELSSLLDAKAWLNVQDGYESFGKPSYQRQTNKDYIAKQNEQPCVSKEACAIAFVDFKCVDGWPIENHDTMSLYCAVNIIVIPEFETIAAEYEVTYQDMSAEIAAKELLIQKAIDRKLALKAVNLTQVTTIAQLKAVVKLLLEEVE